MSQLVLEIQSDSDSVRTIIAQAVRERVQNLDATVRLVRISLGAYEQKYGMTSEKFYQKYLNADDLPDTSEFQMWAGEYESWLEHRGERTILAEG